MFQIRSHHLTFSKFCALSTSLLMSLLATTQVAHSTQDLSSWLRRMECYELLALHLEQQLEMGTARDKETAAQSLADLYASMLSNADAAKRDKLLQKQISKSKSKPKPKSKPKSKSKSKPKSKSKQ